MSTNTGPFKSPDTPHSHSLPSGDPATEPPEVRGQDRDAVKLMVVTPQNISHSRFDELEKYLEPGDLLLINTSRTLPAALPGVTSTGDHVRLHLSSVLDSGEWLVELRKSKVIDATVDHGEVGRYERAVEGLTVTLPAEVSLTLVGGIRGGAVGTTRLWTARPTGVTDVVEYLLSHGRPIAYSYLRTHSVLASYQNVYAKDYGSAEMPSAGRPITEKILTTLVAQGVVVAPITLHTGVSSLEANETPHPERFRVAEETADQVNLAISRTRRVIAVGTTTVRAIESVVRNDGFVEAGAGWTSRILDSHRGPRVVNGLLTGFHPPDASHIMMLASIIGPDRLHASYAAAVEHHYLWHEFGDSCLYLP